MTEPIDQIALKAFKHLLLESVRTTPMDDVKIQNNGEGVVYLSTQNHLCMAYDLERPDAMDLYNQEVQDKRRPNCVPVHSEVRDNLGLLLYSRRN